MPSPFFTTKKQETDGQAVNTPEDHAEEPRPIMEEYSREPASPELPRFRQALDSASKALETLANLIQNFLG